MAMTMVCSWKGAHAMLVTSWNNYTHTISISNTLIEEGLTRVERGAETHDGKLKLRQTKTGFGSHETFEKADLPRSRQGQIM